ncbi:AMP-binding protein [Frankia sp. Cr1]|uniref:AMP-binding protein n=1 Tax=Frankia sp. Cr1 TaxID=3073931 RepID=UPI002AD320CE|nr:AMP-binding protein [Frankia sp. Cr1]
MTRQLTLAALLAQVSMVRRDALAVVDDRERITHAALRARIDEAATGLGRLALTPGSRYGVQLGNSVTALAVLFAGWAHGAVPVNVNRRYRATEVADLVDTHGLRGLITETHRAEEMREVTGPRGLGLAVPGRDAADVLDVLSVPVGAVPVGSRPDDYLLFTGGTTGRPKAVRWHQHDAFLAAMHPRNRAEFVRTAEELGEHAAAGGPATLVAAPVDHAFGQWVAVATLLAGGTVVMTDRRPFDPGFVLDLAHRERCTDLNVAGQAFVTGLVGALESGAVVPAGLERLVTGGAETHDRTKRALWQHVPRLQIIEGIGASETGTLGRTVQTADASAPLTPRFVPSPGTAVVDEKLRPVRAGEEGRLARRGWVAMEYLADEAATRSRFPVVAGERWAVLDDAAQLEADGTFVLRGRLDRVINTGGEKVHPGEVEEVLLAYPDVADAVVLAEPDERYGTRVVALVVLGAASCDTEGLRAWARTRMAGFKVPARIVSVPAVRRLSSGKLDLPWAWEQLEHG